MKRDRILLVVFLIGAGAYAGNWLYQTQIADRFDEKQQILTKARKVVTKKKREVIQSRAAKLDLAEWEKFSLPPDPNTAIPQYQAFLLELLKQSGFPEPTITPRAAGLRDDTYWRLPFDVEARGSMEALVTFVDAFHRVKLLHKLGQLSMTPIERDGNNELDLRFGVEAMALITDAGAESDADASNSEQSASSRPFAQLLENNLLMRQGPGPGAQPGQLAAQVYLTGTIVTGDEPEALFFNRTTSESLVLHVGDTLAVGDVRAELVDVGLSDAVLDLRGTWYRVALGDNLAQRSPVTDSELIARALFTTRTDEPTISP